MSWLVSLVARRVILEPVVKCQSVARSCPTPRWLTRSRPLSCPTSTSVTAAPVSLRIRRPVPESPIPNVGTDEQTHAPRTIATRAKTMQRRITGVQSATGIANHQVARHLGAPMERLDLRRHISLSLPVTQRPISGPGDLKRRAGHHRTL